jgi:hypothetical protein
MCALGLVLSTSYKFPFKIKSDMIECYIHLTFLFIFCFNRLPLMVQTLSTVLYISSDNECLLSKHVVCSYKQRIRKYFSLRVCNNYSHTLKTSPWHFVLRHPQPMGFFLCGNPYKKQVKLQFFQSRQSVIYGHESHGTRNQDRLCRRGPTAIQQSVSPWGEVWGLVPNPV